MISLIIPTQSKQKAYTDNIVKHIEELYPNRTEVEIVVTVDDKATLGQNYNNAVKQSNGEKIILLHNDMMLSRGFVETMDKHIQKGRITTYTRVEPPIFPGIMPGKVLYDCGTDLDSFDRQKWESFYMPESLVPGGSQLFFGCMKEDYIGIDGYTFKMFCEDDDLHLRYQLLGFQKAVSSAHVYHFVSKTSRTSEDSKRIEMASRQAFQEKWNRIIYIN